jgi:hypothetical protein
VLLAATNSSGQTIGYLTVAGSVNAAAQSECSAVTQGSGWTAVASSPFHETLYTPVCFITFDAGHLTRSVDGSIHLRPRRRRHRRVFSCTSSPSRAWDSGSSTSSGLAQA